MSYICLAELLVVTLQSIRSVLYSTLCTRNSLTWPLNWIMDSPAHLPYYHWHKDTLSHIQTLSQLLVRVTQQSDWRDQGVPKMKNIKKFNKQKWLKTASAKGAKSWRFAPESSYWGESSNRNHDTERNKGEAKLRKPQCQTPESARWSSEILHPNRWRSRNWYRWGNAHRVYCRVTCCFHISLNTSIDPFLFRLKIQHPLWNKMYP